MVFSRKQAEVRGSKVRRTWGMGKNFLAAVSGSSHRIVVQEQNALSQFVLIFTRDIFYAEV
jgi:hypothetical protein